LNPDFLETIKDDDQSLNDDKRILIADDQKFNIEALIIILEYFVKVDT
jgi:hypothetical protein